MNFYNYDWRYFTSFLVSRLSASAKVKPINSDSKKRFHPVVIQLCVIINLLKGHVWKKCTEIVCFVLIISFSHYFKMLPFIKGKWKCVKHIT